MENTNYLTNFSYVFIPFCIGKGMPFLDFNKDLKESSKWVEDNDKIRYLHRYVSERLLTGAEKTRNLFRYRFDKESKGTESLRFGEYCYSTSPHKYKDEENVRFEFRLDDVQLFAFNTSVCILAYKIRFLDENPYHIAAAQYYLRKINSECIKLKMENGSEMTRTFINFSEDILGDLIEKYKLDFFFYAPQGAERANFFTYVDLPKKDDYSEELYFLKWSYKDNFFYVDESDENDCLDYRPDEDKVWGISPSASVCIVNREKNKQFIEETFQKNFQKQYLFTYVLLLHQKYMLYLYLTKITVDIDNDLELLEKYNRELYEFETRYIFTQISEVPQYQRFYEKTMEIFKIKEMFDNVQEPLSQLAEISRITNEAKMQRHERSINTALIVVSLLTIVSAITDASGITSNLDWLISPEISKIIQLSAIAMVFIVSIAMIIRLISIKNDSR